MVKLTNIYPYSWHVSLFRISSRFFVLFVSVHFVTLFFECRPVSLSDSTEFSSQTLGFGVAHANPERKLNAERLWQTVDRSLRLSLTQRRRFAESLHTWLSKLPEDQTKDRAHVFAALSVVHASDFLLRHSALSFLAAAQKVWPEFSSTKTAVYVWTKFLEFMDRKQIVNEHLLSRAAETLARGRVASEESVEFPYYLGWSLYRAGKYSDALSIFSKVPLTSPHYRRAKFLEATSLVMLERIADARETYQVVVSLVPTQSEEDFRIPDRSIQRLRDLASLNVARLLYEQKQFAESLAYYRSLDQNSFFFYESLAEQGWLFFMVGFPGRALGSAYSATSPFFADRFNPDVYFLFATLYFWLCHYDYAKEGVARFISHTKSEGDRLRVFLSGLEKLSSAQRVDRLLSALEAVEKGLNPKSIGLGPKTLAFLGYQEGLRDTYEGYNALKQRRIQVQQLPLGREMKERVLTGFEEFESELAGQVALHAQDALLGLKDDYENALNQSRLLWLEILTAQKDKLMGKERSVDGNQFVGDESTFVDAVTRGKNTTWLQDKQEFWFDELNSFVFEVPSQCTDVGSPTGASSGQ
jgi:tetratricopeptide (TPR) repeat protein